jgi:hypothetical protein
MRFPRLPSITSYVFYFIEVEAAWLTALVVREVRAFDGKRGAIVRLLRCQVRELALLRLLSHPFIFCIVKQNEMTLSSSTGPLCP